MKTLLIATRNQHKAEEIRAILGGQFDYFTLNDFPAAITAAETGKTFQENATIKATALAAWLAHKPKLLLSMVSKREKFFVLADDSGLEVDSLNGAPGVHSARFAALDSGVAGNSPDSANNLKLLRLLDRVPLEKRTARFRCVLALTPLPLAELAEKPSESTVESFSRQTVHCDGTCEGKIISQPSGKGGFGYDPLFVPDGYSKTFAELGEEVKNKISHRAKALEKLRQYLRKGKFV